MCSCSADRDNEGYAAVSGASKEVRVPGWVRGRRVALPEMQVPSVVQLSSEAVVPLATDGGLCEPLPVPLYGSLDLRERHEGNQAWTSSKSWMCRSLTLRPAHICFRPAPACSCSGTARASIGQLLKEGTRDADRPGRQMQLSSRCNTQSSGLLVRHTITCTPHPPRPPNNNKHHHNLHAKYKEHRVKGGGGGERGGVGGTAARDGQWRTTCCSRLRRRPPDSLKFIFAVSPAVTFLTCPTASHPPSNLSPVCISNIFPSSHF